MNAPASDRLRRLYIALKRWCLRHLPEPLLQRVKRRHYARVLRDFDPSDEPDLAVVRHLVRPGDTVMDLGANVGVYTRTLSAWVGPRGRVVSVEAMPQTFDLLTHNIRALAMANVRAVNAAVSARAGEVTLEVPAWDGGGENFYMAHVVEGAASSGNRRVAVRAVTADALAVLHPGISFVKCDVEGHELACIEGAVGLIERSRPAWLIEVSGDPDAEGTQAATLLARMEEHGYTPWLYADGRLTPRRNGDAAINVFFLTSDHRVAIEERAPGLIANPLSIAAAV